MELPKSFPKVLKIAVVGTGNRAQAHLQAIARMTDMFQLVAVCDALSERAREVGARYGVPAYADLEMMMEGERPDVVLVTVPPEAHHTVACRAAELGAHVLCETPIAITLPYADAMIAAARRGNVKLEVAENVWRFPAERFKRLLLDSGMIGQVRNIRLWYTSGSYHGINAVRVLAGSEPVRVVGMAKVVELDVKRRWFVDPYHFHTFAPAGAEVPAMLSETHLASFETGLIEFANGVVASYEFPIARPRGNAWEVQASGGFIEGNRVLVAGRERELRIVTETESGVITRVRLYDGDAPVEGPVWENPFVEYGPQDGGDVAIMDQLTSIYRAAVEGIEPEYGAAAARTDLEVLIAVRESARLGSRPIELPLKEETGYEARLHQVYGAPPVAVAG